MSILLRPHQIRARDALLGVPRGIVKVPAGGGKTIIAAAALDALPAGKEMRLSVLWLANTREQCSQAQDALDLFGLRDRHDITIRCAAGGWHGEAPDVLIVDECHHAAADEWKATICKAPGIRWGLSATPERADERAQMVYSLLGPVVITVDRSELTGAGHLTHARVVMHPIGPKDSIEASVKAAAQQEYSRRMRRFPWLSRDETMQRCLWAEALTQGIICCPSRNQAVLEAISMRLDEGRNTLVLVGSIEHGEALMGAFPQAKLIHSKIGKRKRAEIIEGTRNGTINCLFATSLADEGLDIPRLNALVLVNGGRSAAKVEQRTGRVLRAFEGQEDGVIDDFTDDHHYFLRAQSRARVKLYYRLNYQVVLQ